MFQVFLAWSGIEGRRVAHILKTWLESLFLNTLKGWISDKNIVDAVWFNEITRAISASGAGIVCITRESYDRPWILFEAGGLIVKCGKTAVFNLLVDVESEELDGLNYPLFPCEFYSLQRDRFLDIVVALNKLLSSNDQLSDDKLIKSFDSKWDNLESDLKAVSEATSLPLYLLNPRRYRVQMTRRWSHIYPTFVAKHIGESPFQFENMIKETTKRILICGQNLYFLAGEEDPAKEEQRKEWVFKALLEGKRIDILLCNPSWRFSHAVRTWGQDVMGDKRKYKRHLKYSINTFRKWLSEVEQDNRIQTRRFSVKMVPFVPLSITFVDPEDEGGKLAITTAVYERQNNRLRSCYLILRKEHYDIFTDYWEGYREIFEDPKTPTV